MIHARSRLFALVISFFLPFGVNNAGAIIDGVPAEDGEFPWVAGIVRKGNFASLPLIGGGALLGNQWVITAAHSVAGASPESIEVWLGVTDLGNPASRQIRNVLAIFIHPNFSDSTNGTSDSDLALLLLDEAVVGLSSLPVLGNPHDLLVDDPVTVAGWGTSTAGVAQATSKLQKAPAIVIEQTQAEAVFGDIITPAHLPAVDPDSLATPCVGDSGSPLVKYLAGQAFLVGLVSFGTVDCGDASLPTIYARIPLFASWIEQYLALTENPSHLSLTGKNRFIAGGSRPKTANATDFGTFKYSRKKRSRTFVIANRGAGLLTIRATLTNRRLFTMVQAPATIVASGSSTPLTVSFKAPLRKKQYRGQVRILSNDAAQPVFMFKVRATVK